MNQIKILIVIIMIIIMTGCSNISNSNLNQSDETTKYYTIENGNKIYHEDLNFIKSIPDFDLIVGMTIKSFNEVRDGERNLDFVNKIASKELIDNEEYKLFSKLAPKDTELKVTNSDVFEYSIDSLVYDKDLNQIKVNVSIKTKEKNKDGITTVLDNQAYIFLIDNDELKLLEYNLEQHL